MTATKEDTPAAKPAKKHHKKKAAAPAAEAAPVEAPAAKEEAPAAVPAKEAAPAAPAKEAAPKTTAPAAAKAQKMTYTDEEMANEISEKAADDNNDLSIASEIHMPIARQSLSADSFDRFV